jgi:hypothetical protein
MSLKSINEAFDRQFNSINDRKNEEFEVLESLSALLRNLNEAEMSDEDRRESDLIRSAYNKIQKRVNARLTPEEQAVLDKYGIQREYKDLKYATDRPNFDYSTNLVDNSDDRFVHGKQVGRYYSRKNTDGTTDYSRGGYTVKRDTDKINYADRARKRPERLKNREFNYTYNDTWSRDGYSDIVGEIDYNIKPSASEDERTRHGISQNAAIDRMSQSNFRKMRGLLDKRKDAQKDLDNAQAKFDREKARADTEYMKKMQDAEKQYDRSMEYAKNRFDSESNPERRDKAQSDIDTMLKRKKTEAVDLSDKKGSMTKILSDNDSWKNETTVQGIYKKVKSILDDNGFNTEASKRLLTNIAKQRSYDKALETVYNSILAGSNLSTKRGTSKDNKNESLNESINLDNYAIKKISFDVITPANENIDLANSDLYNLLYDVCDSLGYIMASDSYGIDIEDMTSAYDISNIEDILDFEEY